MNQALQGNSRGKMNPETLVKKYPGLIQSTLLNLLVLSHYCLWGYERYN